MESDEHSELVEELAQAMSVRWPNSEALLDSKLAGGEKRRIRIGRYIPDVVLIDRMTRRIISIGEAKRYDDIESNHTTEQLMEWIEQSNIPICLAMSRGFRERMEDKIESATGVEKGKRIHLFDGLYWRLRPEGSLGVWEKIK